MLVQINPNIRHTEKSSDKHPLSYIALGIDDLLFDFPDHSGQDSEDTALSQNGCQITRLHSDQADILPLLKMILAEAHRHEPASEQILPVPYFSKSYGVAPINYLLDRRILNSKELLKNTDYSITHIAHMTGFSSANYFSQSFKKHTGITAAAYRKIFKKSYKKVLTFLRSGSIILLVPRGTTKKQALEHAEVSELADEQD
uniref:helix-turn-helix transcriptional regulator n=1 Tax=Mediterraneibacter glycyrrhizinilyticus TaxID=342942 RepID=UPI001FA6E613